MLVAVRASRQIGVSEVRRFDERASIVRTADGTYYTIDVPCAVFTQTTTIDDPRDAGTCRFANDSVMYTTLDVPGCSSSVVAGAMACTTPRKINDAGQIVGFYGTGRNTISGFLATAQ